MLGIAVSTVSLSNLGEQFPDGELSRPVGLQPPALGWAVIKHNQQNFLLTKHAFCPSVESREIDEYSWGTAVKESRFSDPYHPTDLRHVSYDILIS